jgi:predicted HicB family RNase H-like nuclease
MRTRKPKEVVTVLKLTTVRLPADLLKAARLYALNHETSLQALMTEALETRIKRVK